jgi:hypothetical protein
MRWSQRAIEANTPIRIGFITHRSHTHLLSVSKAAQKHLSLIELGPVRVRALGVGAQALGALALGTLAIGTIAVGAVVIGRLFIGKARIRKLHIDELTVGRLRIHERLDSPDQAAL